jgi:hypothetical protein
LSLGGNAPIPAVRVAPISVQRHSVAELPAAGHYRETLVSAR